MFFIDANIYHVAFNMLIVWINGGSNLISSMKNAVK